MFHSKRISRLILSRPRKNLHLLIAAIFFAGLLPAQVAPTNGPRSIDPRWHALVGATLIPRPKTRIENATIVMRNGRIVTVEAGGTPPAGARVWDCKGLTVHAGLIDAHVPVETPHPESGSAGAHWNEKVLAQRSALSSNGIDVEVREELRGLGFTAAAIAPADGIFRGTGAVVLLDEPTSKEGIAHVSVVRERVYHSVAFDRGGGNYPRSTMGVIALIRQTLLDAEWHAECARVYGRTASDHEPPQANVALDTLGTSAEKKAPLLIHVGNANEALVAKRLGKEFGRDVIILGDGDGYRRLEALGKTSLVLPLRFPEPPALGSISDIERASLRELMAWEQAPTNPRRITRAGIRGMLTTDGLEKRDGFLDNLRRAIEHGLTEDEALEMLTTVPASALGVADKLGTVEPGMLANLVITDGKLFDRKAIRSVWVRGQRYIVNPVLEQSMDGTWAIAGALLSGSAGKLIISEGKTVTFDPSDEDTKESKAGKVRITKNGIDCVLSLSANKEGKDAQQAWVIRAIAEGEKMFGRTFRPDGAVSHWTAQRISQSREASGNEKPSKPYATEVPDDIPRPFGAFGLFEPPEQRSLWITNATIWTGGEMGIIDKGGIYIDKGKIAWVGPSEGAEPPAGAEVIDASGKHLTPGLIDCHSHSGISGGVNEGTQACTAEVRISDVVDPGDIVLYRQLAGGVTTINQLHGSSNPIGGQNSVVKLRWGALRASDMTMRGAMPGIKFALGENVKRSNSSSPATRYPASRMGVETFIRDRFRAARDYAAKLRRHRSSSPDLVLMPPRRDLELDALTEILGGQRLVHCHSYRQDEILMLCRVANDFGFKIGTFQHGLECYKVAEAVKSSSIGASLFSDWWAYKVEVVDAIPYGGPILHEVGVPVSYNSDSGELARRLNTEAAKAVKYGGVDPHEALKFVTYNAALQLGVADRIGSLEAGKDADFTIWSGVPLSSFSRCEATYIDGKAYFSLEQDLALRDWAHKERQRLIQKVLLHQPSGAKTSNASKPADRLGRAGHEDHTSCCRDDKEGKR
jgi:imidazolonepropionase-like amidohydrolase